jgi:hypothetical protein
VSPCLKVYLSNILTLKYSIKMPLQLISQPPSAELQAEKAALRLEPEKTTLKADFVDVSELKLSLFADGVKKLIFAPEHTNSTQNLKLTPSGEARDDETFTLNGVEYTWEPDTMSLTVTKYNLVKMHSLTTI